MSGYLSNFLFEDFDLLAREISKLDEKSLDFIIEDDSFLNKLDKDSSTKNLNKINSEHVNEYDNFNKKLKLRPKKIIPTGSFTNKNLLVNNNEQDDHNKLIKKVKLLRKPFNLSRLLFKRNNTNTNIKPANHSVAKPIRLKNINKLGINKKPVRIKSF